MQKSLQLRAAFLLRTAAGGGAIFGLGASLTGVRVYASGAKTTKRSQTFRKGKAILFRLLNPLCVATALNRIRRLAGDYGGDAVMVSFACEVLD